MTNSQQDEKIQALRKAYDSSDSEQTAEIYDDWSDDYEEHMRGSGYAHPAMVAAMLTRHHPPGDGPILDAGAGTGIMGEILTALGYSSIAGFDASPGMLARAATKNVYQDLQPGLLGEPLAYPDDGFAATVASGVFTQGHAPLDGLDELIRATRPGGHIVFSISRTYLGDTFETKAQALESAEKWRRVDATRHYDSTPDGGSVLESQVFAFATL